LNYVLAGSADEETRRVIALRDSVFVLRDDGVYRITGDAPNNLQVSLFDNTTTIKGEDTAVPLSNQIFTMTDQGVAAISDSGVQIVSRDVEKELLKIFSDLYTNAISIAFGVGYESDRKYLLWTMKETTDTVATQAWVYNVFTNAWTRRERVRNCGFVNTTDDRLYMGHGTTFVIRQERKSFTVEDYAEDEYAVTITAFSGTTVNVNSTASAVVGQTLGQATGALFSNAVVTVVNDATTLTVDRAVSWTLAAAKLYDPIPIEVEWAPIHGGQPGLVKHWPEMDIFFREANFASIAFSVASNFSFTGSPVTLRPINAGASWGYGGWGSGPWGGGSPPVQAIRTYIPMEQQRANWINVSVEHEEALTELAVAGLSCKAEISTERFR
jgi:hypothetical protein